MSIPIIITADPDETCERAGIPVIAEIEPRPDPVYGHTFTWPPEVAQFLNPPPVFRGEQEGGESHA
jgi:hypothetical protein